MLFVVSLALSLLVLTAGLFLLVKTKDGSLGKFLKVMAWIIVGFGMLLSLMSVHFAVVKHIAHHRAVMEGRENAMFFEGQKPPSGPNCFEASFPGDKEGCGMPCNGPCCKKMMMMKKYMGDEEMEGMHADRLIKVISDSVKLTPEQQKKVAGIIEKAMK